eukprot:4522244-Pyramimonas_sp.AAC.1
MSAKGEGYRTANGGWVADEGAKELVGSVRNSDGSAQVRGIKARVAKVSKALALVIGEGRRWPSGRLRRWRQLRAEQDDRSDYTVPEAQQRVRYGAGADAVQQGEGRDRPRGGL